MTTHQAKKIIRAELEKHGLANKLTAKTADFADLMRDSCIFVEVHDWKPSPIAQDIKQTAKANGFCVEFTHSD